MNKFILLFLIMSTSVFANALVDNDLAETAAEHKISVLKSEIAFASNGACFNDSEDESKCNKSLAHKITKERYKEVYDEVKSLSERLGEKVKPESTTYTMEELKELYKYRTYLVMKQLTQSMQ